MFLIILPDEILRPQMRAEYVKLGQCGFLVKYIV